MKTKLLSNVSGRREWAVILDAGDEAAGCLNQFANSQQLHAAHFTGIGAFASVTVGWFNLETSTKE